MNTPNYGMQGPLTGIIRFLAIVGILTIFAFGGLLGAMTILWINGG